MIILTKQTESVQSIARNFLTAPKIIFAILATFALTLFLSPAIAQDRINDFVSADGTKLSGLLGIAPKAKNAVLIIHGLQSHSEWHRSTVKFLQEQGISSLAFDRRGSGYSEGTDGHMDSADQFVQDAEAAFMRLKKELGADTKIHVMATSFGYTISVPFVKKHRELIESLILVSPAAASTKESDFSAGQKTKIFLSSIKTPLEKFAMPFPLEFIVGDGRGLDFIKNDPLRIDSFTSCFFRHALSMRSFANKNIASLKIPTSLVVAQNDRIVDVKKTKAAITKNNSDFVHVTEFDADHDIGLSGFEQELHAHILGWLLLERN